MPREPIELNDGTIIPVLYEDRTVLALDKPAGWLLAPPTWDRTPYNLQLALMSGIEGREYWAKVRNLKFLRFVHRLDGETSGVVLFAKSAGAVGPLTDLFEERTVDKTYLAVTGSPSLESEWTSRESIEEKPGVRGVMRLSRQGKPAETHFKVLGTVGNRSLLLVKPLTGRTHQIRVHLAGRDLAILGDAIYSKVKTSTESEQFPIALRAIGIRYKDPFTRKLVSISAPTDEFLKEFGFDPKLRDLVFPKTTGKSASHS
ncbi:MAG: RNA pseudouridine synthase [Verrucomicrobiota bacterium]|nr:RNA pseudouridine synthase [Verrucomicrobiota bacterium]